MDLNAEYDLDQYGYAICPNCNGVYSEWDFDGPLCRWCAAIDPKEGL